MVLRNIWLVMKVCMTHTKTRGVYHRAYLTFILSSKATLVPRLEVTNISFSYLSVIEHGILLEFNGNIFSQLHVNLHKYKPIELAVAYLVNVCNEFNSNRGLFSCTQIRKHSLIAKFVLFVIISPKRF